jgi:hypothetical protein
MLPQFFLSIIASVISGFIMLFLKEWFDARVAKIRARQPSLSLSSLDPTSTSSTISSQKPYVFLWGFLLTLGLGIVAESLPYMMKYHEINFLLLRFAVAPALSVVAGFMIWRRRGTRALLLIIVPIWIVLFGLAQILIKI